MPRMNSPIQRIADDRSPMAAGRLDSSLPGYHWHVFLWPDQAMYEAAADVRKSGTNAMCCTDTWVDETTGRHFVQDRLGEIHFVSGLWDVNTVAHEVQHAILHRLRNLTPGPQRVIDENAPTYSPEAEEVIAYEAGDWVEALLVWLTNEDPASPYPRNVFER